MEGPPCERGSKILHFQLEISPAGEFIISSVAWTKRTKSFRLLRQESERIAAATLRIGGLELSACASAVMHLCVVGICYGGKYWRFFHGRRGEAECILMAESDAEAEAFRNRLRVLDWHCPAVPANAMRLGKFACRLDLMLSATAVVAAIGPASLVPALHPFLIPDIYCGSALMTDGCGFVSKDIAAAAARALQQAPACCSKGCPLTSAVQARIGGFKGVWLVHTQLPPNTICMRPSQQKIELIGLTRSPPIILGSETVSAPCSPHAVLLEASPISWSGTYSQLCFEALRVSVSSGPSALNLQIILLLLSWGVPVAVLTHLAEIAWQAFSALIGISGGDRSICTPSRTAVHLGQCWLSHASADESRARRMLNAGLWGESELTLILKRICDRRQSDMLHKLHIPIRLSRRCMIVPDPTGLLAQGEVFLRLSSPDEDVRTERGGVVLGPVLLARNPCHSPTDIFVAHAVSLVDIATGATASGCARDVAVCWEAALLDVVVMSVYSSHESSEVVGTRNLSDASRLSGGDFDGDTVFVTWDQQIVEPVRAAQTKVAAAAVTKAIEAAQAAAGSLEHALTKPASGCANELSLTGLSDLVSNCRIGGGGTTGESTKACFQGAASVLPAAHPGIETTTDFTQESSSSSTRGYDSRILLQLASIFASSLDQRNYQLGRATNLHAAGLDLSLEVSLRGKGALLEDSSEIPPLLALRTTSLPLTASHEPDLLKLAGLCSQLVDSQKTGACITVSEEFQRFRTPHYSTQAAHAFSERVRVTGAPRCEKLELPSLSLASSFTISHKRSSVRLSRSPVAHLFDHVLNLAAIQALSNFEHEHAPIRVRSFRREERGHAAIVAAAERAGWRRWASVATAHLRCLLSAEAGKRSRMPIFSGTIVLDRKSDNINPAASLAVASVMVSDVPVFISADDSGDVARKLLLTSLSSTAGIGGSLDDKVPPHSRNAHSLVLAYYMVSHGFLKSTDVTTATTGYLLTENKSFVWQVVADEILCALDEDAAMCHNACFGICSTSRAPAEAPSNTE